MSPLQHQLLKGRNQSSQENGSENASQESLSEYSQIHTQVNGNGKHHDSFSNGSGSSSAPSVSLNTATDNSTPSGADSPISPSSSASNAPPRSDSNSTGSQEKVVPTTMSTVAEINPHHVIHPTVSPPVNGMWYASHPHTHVPYYSYPPYYPPGSHPYGYMPPVIPATSIAVPNTLSQSLPPITTASKVTITAMTPDVAPVMSSVNTQSVENRDHSPAHSPSPFTVNHGPHVASDYPTPSALQLPASVNCKRDGPGSTSSTSSAVRATSEEVEEGSSEAGSDRSSSTPLETEEGQTSNDNGAGELPNGNKKKPEARHYQCQYCLKRFARPSSLTTHIYSHTGERPFKCTNQGCGRGFSVLSNLRRHHRVCQKNLSKKFAFLAMVDRRGDTQSYGVGMNGVVSTAPAILSTAAVLPIPATGYPYPVPPPMVPIPPVVSSALPLNASPVVPVPVLVPAPVIPPPIMAASGTAPIVPPGYPVVPVPHVVATGQGVPPYGVGVHVIAPPRPPITESSSTPGSAVGPDGVHGAFPQHTSPPTGYAYPHYYPYPYAPYPTVQPAIATTGHIPPPIPPVAVPAPAIVNHEINPVGHAYPPSTTSTTPLVTPAQPHPYFPPPRPFDPMAIYHNQTPLGVAPGQARPLGSVASQPQTCVLPTTLPPYYPVNPLIHSIPPAGPHQQHLAQPPSTSTSQSA